MTIVLSSMTSRGTVTGVRVLSKTELTYRSSAWWFPFSLRSCLTQSRF